MKGEKIEVDIPVGRFIITSLIIGGVIVTLAFLGGNALAKISS